MIRVWGRRFDLQSEELKARLRKLEELAERKAYAELVKDITPKKETDEPFSSYKDQIGFGMKSKLLTFALFVLLVKIQTLDKSYNPKPYSN